MGVKVLHKQERQRSGNWSGINIKKSDFRKKNTCTAFLSSCRRTTGSLGEREMLWEHKPQASVSKAFSVEFSQTFTSVCITRQKHGVYVFFYIYVFFYVYVFFQKTTRREKHFQLAIYSYFVRSFPLCPLQEPVKSFA